jgi:hemolysin-activating ACP:hemolysin acyltransferase
VEPAAAATSQGAATPQGVAPRVNDRLAMEFGKVAVVLLSSQRHRALPLGEVFLQVMPYVAAGQCMVAGAKAENADSAAPIAAIMWANVSDEIDQRLTSDPAGRIAVGANEYRSGSHAWIIEAIGPGKVVEAMLNQLVTGPLKGQPLKLRRKNQDGQLVVETWPVPAAA